MADFTRQLIREAFVSHSTGRTLKRNPSIFPCSQNSNLAVGYYMEHFAVSAIENLSSAAAETSSPPELLFPFQLRRKGNSPVQRKGVSGAVPDDEGASDRSSSSSSSSPSFSGEDEEEGKEGPTARRRFRQPQVLDLNKETEKNPPKRERLRRRMSKFDRNRRLERKEREWKNCRKKFASGGTSSSWFRFDRFTPEDNLFSLLLTIVMTCAPLRIEIWNQCLHPSAHPFPGGGSVGAEDFKAVLVEEGRQKIPNPQGRDSKGNGENKEQVDERVCRLFSMVINCDKTGQTVQGPVKIPFSPWANVLLTIYLEEYSKWIRRGEGRQAHALDEGRDPGTIGLDRFQDDVPWTFAMKTLFPNRIISSSRVRKFALERLSLVMRMHDLRQIAVVRMGAPHNFMARTFDELSLVARHTYKTAIENYGGELVSAKGEELEYQRPPGFKSFQNMDLHQLIGLLPRAKKLRGSEQTDIARSLYIDPSFVPFLGIQGSRPEEAKLCPRDPNEEEDLETVRLEDVVPNGTEIFQELQNNFYSHQREVDQRTQEPEVTQKPRREIDLYFVLPRPRLGFFIGLDVSENCIAVTVVLGVPWAELFIRESFTALQRGETRPLCLGLTIEYQGAFWRKSRKSAWFFKEHEETIQGQQASEEKIEEGNRQTWFQNRARTVPMYARQNDGILQRQRQVQLLRTCGNNIQQHFQDGNVHDIGVTSPVTVAKILLDRVHRHLNNRTLYPELGPDERPLVYFCPEKDIRNRTNQTSVMASQVILTRDVSRIAATVLMPDITLEPLPSEALRAATILYSQEYKRIGTGALEQSFERDLPVNGDARKRHPISDVWDSCNCALYGVFIAALQAGRYS